MLPNCALVREIASGQSTAPIPKLVGRSAELSHLKDLLSGPSLAANIFLVGERGVGIRTLIEHLALELHDSSEGAIRELLELNLTELRGTGSQTEEAVTQLVEKITEGPGTCLYVEDFESLFQNSSRNAPHFRLFVDLIRSKKLRVIGTLSASGLAWLRRSEPKVAQKSNLVVIEALSSSETLKILRSRKEDLCTSFSLDISTGAISAAVELSKDALPGQPLPGGALDVLHKACSRHSLRHRGDSRSAIQSSGESSREVRGSEVSHYDVKRVVKELSSLEFSADEAQSLAQKVRSRLGKAVIGQADALKDLSESMVKIASNFGKLQRPAGLLMLVGPRGTGKALALQTLAETILHDEHDMAVFDMRNFSTDSSVRGLFGIDAEMSMGELDAGVEQATRRAPISLLVFKYFSAAPPHFFQILEAILATGNYRAQSGERVDLRRAILVLTDDLHHRDMAGSGLGESSASYAENLVPPKVAHGLDGVIHFRDLSEEDYQKLIKREVNAFRREFGSGRPKCRIHRAVLDHLIQSARDSNVGSEDLIANLNEHIFKPARLILQKKSALNFVHLRITLETDKIRVQLGAPAKPSVQRSERE